MNTDIAMTIHKAKKDSNNFDQKTQPSGKAGFKFNTFYLFFGKAIMDLCEELIIQLRS